MIGENVERSDWHFIRTFEQQRIAWLQTRIRAGQWVMVEGTLRYSRLDNQNRMAFIQPSKPNHGNLL